MPKAIDNKTTETLAEEPKEENKQEIFSKSGEAISKESHDGSLAKVPARSQAGFFSRVSDKEKRFLFFFFLFVFVMFASGSVLFFKIFTLKNTDTAKSSQATREVLDDGRIIAPPLANIEEPEIIEEEVIEPVPEEETIVPVQKNEEKEISAPETNEAVAGYMNTLRNRSEIYFPEIRNMEMEWVVSEQGEKIVINSLRYSIKRTKLNLDKLSIDELFAKDKFIKNTLNSNSLGTSQITAWQKDDMVCLYNKSASIDSVARTPIEDRYDLFLSCGVLTGTND